MKHLPHIIVLLVAALCLPLMAAVDTKLSTYTYNLQEGWNLIGIVLEPTDESEQELLAHKIYAYTDENAGKSYRQAEAIAAGKAYWIFSETGESLFIKGVRVDNPTEEPVPQENGYVLTVGTQDIKNVGEEVTITATEKTNYTFTGWTVDGVSVPDTSQETISFLMPSNKVLVAANYIDNRYTLTMEEKTERVELSMDDIWDRLRNGDGEVEVPRDENNESFIPYCVYMDDINDTFDGFGVSFTRPADDENRVEYHPINYGELVTMTAETKEGHTFVGWTVEGITVADCTSPSISFNMPANDVKLIANYNVNSYGYTQAEFDPYLAIYVESGIQYIAVAEFLDFGNKITVTENFSDMEGYTFVGWEIEGVSIPDKTSRTISFTMPANAVTLSPNYTANSYTLTTDGVDEQVDYGASVSKTAPAKEGYTFTGWTVTGVTVKNASANPLSFTMPANAVTLTAVYSEIPTGTYYVVNLETREGRNSSSAPDLSSDTCRTTELWLRKIPKGTFTMGSPEDELGRYNPETQHQVTLTEDFYIGVFEMTQKQYELIYGSNPSLETGDTRPVEWVSYNDLRGSSTGAGWPSSHDVDSDSFLGKLRAKTGLVFDLPTDAQWEYACRAGTTTAINTGKDLTYPEDQDSAMDEAGRYFYNHSDGKGGYSQHTKVGSYLPNNWGLYDMHGNVGEWCLDWPGSYSGDATDPKGATSGSYRVMRGGSFYDYARHCRSACRGVDSPSVSCIFIGFRVVLLP